MLAPSEVGTREHVLLWLASKPADERYEWTNPERCACGQYARQHKLGMINPSGRGYDWQSDPTCNKWAVDLNSLAGPFHPGHTFGELYERCYAAWNK